MRKSFGILGGILCLAIVRSVLGVIVEFVPESNAGLTGTMMTTSGLLILLAGLSTIRMFRIMRQTYPLTRATNQPTRKR